MKGKYSRTTDVGEMKKHAAPAICSFYDYWDGKRRGRAMPARADLDPAEMKKWLGAIQIIDVLNDPRRLKYRLVGQDEVDARGYNPMGRWVEDGYICSSKEDALLNYNTVIDNKTMLFDWVEIPVSGGYLEAQQTIFLPLSAAGDTVDKVITFTVIRAP